MPRRGPCLEFALATNQEAGVWGGHTEDERRRLRKGLDVVGDAAPPLAWRNPTALEFDVGISTGTRTCTDVPSSSCISIEPWSSLVTSAWTIDSPSPRDPRA